ncbi:LSU ribosomal protein L4p (L1e) [Olavius algarvensis spirochete endosymbiont]|uniref:50S ribosomal protein L4 n=1 Tax=Olavius algarvensis spirochete endosymbiont TaxID=260710 RepID=UPI000F156EBC|nr:50S ribosomal protein L4 [Olavius algarvensis spirochete endosymbiont]CAD7844041.1 MAG: LSU ribosomal protein L4p (L1e) [Olavius algarvensis spirochete endosymbiont]VDB01091.1 LSU ribosomal protein L4p (L1e) [Olavius algarvensis spirochete endosymbiont]
MEKKVYSKEGKELRNIVLEDAVFARKVSEGSIWHAIKNELANARQGTAKSKNRHEVRGSSCKPWRQKGTGRARAGSRRSPLWRGGGVVFGPRPRDYSYHLPRKIKRLAMKSLLSLRAADDECFKVLEDFSVESGKTRDLVSILEHFPTGGGTVLILDEDDEMTKRAGRNIKNLRFLTFNRLRAHDLFYGKSILVLESAAKKLGEFYGS